MFQIKDTAVFMGLMLPLAQQQQQLLHLQLHQVADDQLSSRHSSASDVSASAADSPTRGDTSEPLDASAALL